MVGGVGRSSRKASIAGPSLSPPSTPFISPLRSRGHCSAVVVVEHHRPSIVPDPCLAAGWEAAFRSLESCGGSLIGSLASVIIVIRFGNFESEGRCLWETPPSLRHRPERSWRAGRHYSLATHTTHSLHFASDQPTNQPTNQCTSRLTIQATHTLTCLPTPIETHSALQHMNRFWRAHGKARLTL